MKLILLSIVLLFSPIILSAQEVGISHYERRIDLPEVVLPGESFDATLFRISFPDSLYSFATIKLRKVKLPTTKVSAEFVVEDDHYLSTRISVKKGQKRKEFLILLEKKLGAEVSDDKTQCFQYNNVVLKLSIDNVKNTFNYSFTLGECEGI